MLQWDNDLEQRTVGSFLEQNPLLAVVSGAGVSTASGIPDYRDKRGDWKHAAPIQYQDFVKNDAARQRYWARSYVGWQRFSQARPNAAHYALAEMEASGKVDTVITQNVDRLHSGRVASASSTCTVISAGYAASTAKKFTPGLISSGC